MTLLTKEQIRALIKERNLKTAEDAQEVLKEMLGGIVTEMLEAEMDTSLGYSKNDRGNKETSNRRNGYSNKIVRSEYGDVDLKVPRDRNNEFNPLVVKKNQKNVTGIDDQILAMYARWMTVRDIQQMDG